MVKLTLVGRLSDGMPLSQTPTYLTEDHEVSSFYRQKGELVLKEIATDYVIGNLRKQYQDTRTQANLFKLNSNRGQDLDIVTEEFSKLISNHQTSGSEARASLVILQTESTLWSSKLLEEIALKWTPITVFVIAAALLLWTSIVLAEYSMLAAW